MARTHTYTTRSAVMRAFLETWPDEAPHAGNARFEDFVVSLEALRMISTALLRHLIGAHGPAAVAEPVEGEPRRRSAERG